MKGEVAVSLRDVVKTFKISHEIGNSVFGHLEGFLTRKKNQRITVLDGVSLDVLEGDFVGVVGKNGCGKTTLAKLISGILTPDSGSIGVKGVVTPVFQLGVGFNLELTGYENVFLNGVLMGMSRREVEDRYVDISDMAGIADFMDVRLKNYSTGMLMRLAFSIAVNSLKDVLIIDEALSVGDYEFYEKSMGLFERLKSSGKTVIMVSHDLEVIEKLCDKCIYLKDGCVEAYGSPVDVIEVYVKDCS